MATLPSPPISSAILSAASAAEARLSVEARGDRNVAVDAGVEGDDRDLGVLGLLQQRDGRLAVDRGEADGRAASWRARPRACRSAGRPAPSVSGPSNVTLTSKSLRGLLGAGLHGLPELMLEALGDERRCRACPAPARRRSCRGGQRRRRAPMRVRLLNMVPPGTMRLIDVCVVGALSPSWSWRGRDGCAGAGAQAPRRRRMSA